MNGTVTANVLPCGMGNAGFWRYENYFPTAMGSSFPHGRAPGFALTAGCQCMETQAKSFAVDGAKCHHLRHGLPSVGKSWREPWGVKTAITLFLSHSLSLSRDHPCITQCPHLADSSGGVPWMSCQAQCPGVQMAFGFLPPSGGLGKWRDKHINSLNHL